MKHYLLIAIYRAAGLIIIFCRISFEINWATINN